MDQTFSPAGLRPSRVIPHRPSLSVKQMFIVLNLAEFILGSQEAGGPGIYDVADDR